ncbi:hypothetical protein [Nodosilinea nodulosa]|uniref:hypothetical protein n=1 Tax=Nodosilinea nodulosa TaxID=416001 RepID=UPI000315EC31|nr:hypothetical protein [Nodosilinea nodulosa]
MQLLNRSRRFHSSDILPLFVLGTLGIQGLLLVMTLLNTARINHLAHRPVPSLVQLVDGHSISTEAVDPNQRTPEVIQQFVKTAMGLMFTWNSQGQTTDTATAASAPAAQGVPVNHGRITTASWQASFALKEDFRTAFLDQVAAITPPGIFSGSAQSVLTIETISTPKELQAGYWQVDIVANLLIFDPTHPQGLAIPFNKSLFVQAVEPAEDPLPETSTPLQKAVYRLRENGLEITEIRDLDIQQLAPNPS